MAGNITKLRNLLAELFMFEFADLDFGIYRIMGSKRADIQRFLDEDLLPQVRKELGKVESGERTTIEDDLNKTVAQMRGFKMAEEVINEQPLVKELRERLAATGDPAALEEEVFSHLAAFFRRYYKDGDYLSLRRYKKDVYALPYEGEEVKLHWANADQYYIKSSEYFRDYTFKLPNGRRVQFKLVEADSEQNNNKAAEGKERRFALADHEPLVEEGGELQIRFAYGPSTEKQATLNKAAVARILAVAGESFSAWMEGLRTKKPTEKDAERTLLEKHVGDYTARNSFDYFIHKDLRGFLRRELDFFIKSEVMLLDDIEEETAPRVEQYLAKVRAIRRIAHKIIDMLGQLEDFQKRLWLKKKFVVETNYCVTLDRVPDELYAEIATNEAQREEWVRLFAIDAIVNTTISPSYSAPLTVDFLRANSFLVLDTKFFSQAFKARLLASFDDLDAQLDGLLVHSENFQALNLLEEHYQGQVKCIYIDPPYNTTNDGFLYKDSYRHSSWLTMIDNRISQYIKLANEDAVLFASIDDNEAGNLVNIVRNREGTAELVTLIAAQLNPRGRTLDKYLAKTHEYIACIALFGGEFAIRELEKTGSAEAEYKFRDAKGRYRLLELRNRNPVFNRANRPNLYFPLYVDPISGSVSPEKTKQHYQEVYPLNSRDEEGCWTWSMAKVKANIAELEGKQVNTGAWRIFRKDRFEKGNGDIATTKAKSIWIDKSINNENGKEVLFDLFGQHLATFPKPVSLIEQCIQIGADEDDLILDAFAGSGTTAQAVINLNREDGGKRKYVLAEMGAYFDTVLKPRVLKVIYSTTWKDGRPVSREGSSHLLKYISLESYEDALNNLALQRTQIQRELLLEEPELREDYMLRYMLDVESRGSASLLNIAAFAHPFNYTLQVADGSVGETRPANVDLVETFNYLLGLRVQHIGETRGVVTVEGRNPEGQRVLVIWRDVEHTDNKALEEFFRKKDYSTRDQEFDLIYVNGDNNLENVRRDDETWKVRLIEQEFQQLMFDVRDI